MVHTQRLSTVDFPDSTFNHQGSDAHLSSSFYYLVAKGVCINSLVNDVDSISDTLRTIYLDAKAINSVPIVASLDWNHMRENFDIATQALYQYNVFSTDTLYSLFYKYDDITGYNLFSKYSDTLTQKDLIFVVMILSFIYKLLILEDVNLNQI